MADIETVQEPPRRKLQHSMHMLSPMLQQIAEEVGVDKAIEIARQLGGRRYYFPERVTAANELIHIVGWRDARRLCRRFAKNREIIPTARHYLRWFDARALLLQGLEIGEIARLIGVVPRHAQELLEGFDPDDWYIDGHLAASLRCPCCGTRPKTAVAHPRPPAPPTSQLDFGFPAR